MIQILEDELLPVLRQANKVRIATALLTPAIFDRISEAIHPNASTIWIVGIDLPTPPSAIEKLMIAQQSSEKVESKIYSSIKTFHPKVYLITDQDGSIAAFVGSANATNGGFKNNVEMTLSTVDPLECKQLIEWFNSIFNEGFSVTPAFLEKYRSYFDRIRSRNASNQSDTSELKKFISAACPPDAYSTNESYFQSVDFYAFGPEREKDKTPLADKERKDVWVKLTQIHYKIYPRFAKFGLSELTCHHNKANIVSAYYHSSYTREKKDAIWLNYGYAKSELQGSKLMDHPRIQVILRENKIGLWLVIGKNYGSLEERKNFRQKIETDPIFLTLFHKEIIDLGGSYEVEINNDDIHHKLQISNISSTEILKDFILRDDKKFYFTIRRSFLPNDDKLFRENIFETILVEFARLLPIYKLFKNGL